MIKQQVVSLTFLNIPVVCQVRRRQETLGAILSFGCVWFRNLPGF